jgi:TRAP-type C4-dicarboxylate transport system substrate-binding protein
MAAGLLLGLFATAASQAEEITLKAVSAFAKDSFFERPFSEFVKKVNAEGKGLVQIRVIGGPESMPPFELGNAIRSGVLDLTLSTGVFHANLVPEALVMTLTDKPMSALRANGGYQLLDKIHREKANMVWLARVSDGLQYHIYTNKKPESDSFNGMKLRSVPVYRSFFQALGAVPLQVPPGEVFTALERGVVDGYGWPSVGIFDLGWQEKTKYRIDPGFYNVETSLFMNQNTWNKLGAAQRAFLDKQVQALEAQHAQERELAVQEKQRQTDAGIETITLSGEQATAFIARANEAGWKTIEQASPNHAGELQKLFGSP